MSRRRSRRTWEEKYLFKGNTNKIKDEKLCWVIGCPNNYKIGSEFCKDHIDRENIQLTGLLKKGLPDTDDDIITQHGKTVVRRRDIIQPYEDGKPNQAFMDRYGDGMLKGTHSQLDGRGNYKQETPRDYKEV